MSGIKIRPIIMKKFEEAQQKNPQLISIIEEVKKVAKSDFKLKEDGLVCYRGQSTIVRDEVDE